MENSRPEDGSMKKWVSDREMEELSRLTQRNIDIIDKDEIETVAAKLFEYTDFDKDRLLRMSLDELYFLYDELKLGQAPKSPDFYTRLDNQKKIKDLLDKIARGEI